MRGLTLKEKIKFIQEKFEQFEITAYQVNKDTGLSAKGIQKILDGDTKKPRNDTLNILLQYLENKALGSQINEPELFYPGNPKKTKNIGVPYYGVDFASGYDSFVNADNAQPNFHIDYEPYNHADFWVNNIGNSMSPKIENGDLIALKEKTDVNQIIYGEIYAIVLPEMRTIKYLRKSQQDKYIKFVPENTTEYDDQDMPIELIQKFFLVLGSIKKFF